MSSVEGSDEDAHGHPTCAARWPGTFACLDLASISIPLSVTIFLLVLFALVTEHIIHTCIHRAAHDRFWRTFAAALLAELSMLGIISFVLFSISQLAPLTDDHIHLIEFVHLTLFLMMIFYYLVVGWIAYSSKAILSKYGDYEVKVANFDLLSCVSELRNITQQRKKRWCHHPISYLFASTDLDKKMQVNAYLLTRHFFLISHGLPPNLPFDYAEYVDRCTSALLVKLVQVGYRTWVGILIICITSTVAAAIADEVSVHHLDFTEDMWSDTAAVNQDYFWVMFFIGWAFYLINGLIWAGFENSRASLIVLTAQKESSGENLRSSRFEQNWDDISIGNFLRSTVSRDWSHGGRHSHQRLQRQERAANTDVIRQANRNTNVRAHNSSLHSNHTTASHASQASHATNASHGTHATTDSLEKTERTLSQACLPCLTEPSEWRKCFPLRAPEFPLRTFQAVLMFFSLFLGLGLLVFFHIDPVFMAFSIFQPFMYLYMFGLQQVPLYATLRFFGPDLSKNSLVDDLVFFAQELQYEEFRSSNAGAGGKEAKSEATETTATDTGSNRTTEAAPGLLRGWSDHSSVLNRDTRISFREPTIVEDEVAVQDGDLLRGWGEHPTLRPSKAPGPNPPDFYDPGRLSLRQSALTRDSHFEALVNARRSGSSSRPQSLGFRRSAAGGGSEGPITDLMQVLRASEKSQGGAENREPLVGEGGEQGEYTERDVRGMLDEICTLLNCTGSRQFRRIAVARGVVLAGFFVMWITMHCEEAPGLKVECSWLTLL